MSRKQRPWVPVPLRPAAAWSKLPVATRLLGLFLFTHGFADDAEQPVLGIELASKPGRDGKLEYPQVETWALGLTSATGDERKTVRADIRRIVQHGLLIAVPGGVLLLYRSEEYAKYSKGAGGSASGGDPLTDPSPGVDLPLTDPSPGADLPPNVPLTDPSPGSDLPLTSPSPSEKSAESLGPNSQRERERERKRERETRASEPDVEALIREGFSARFKAVHGVEPTWGRTQAPLLRRLAKWLVPIEGDVVRNVGRLLDGFFVHKWASHPDVNHPFGALANSPERYWPNDGASSSRGASGSYLFAASDFGAPTNLDLLGPLPPYLGAAE